MLLADIALRRLSHGAKGLEDCLRGVMWSGLDGSRRVGLADHIATSALATGTRVMSTLAERHVTNSARVDFASLWRTLGMSSVGTRIVFDDSVPATSLHRMIVSGKKPNQCIQLPWQR